MNDEKKDELRFRGDVEVGQSFTITDPVALIQEHEGDWIRLGQEIPDDGYQAWERFGVFVHELMKESTPNVDLNIKHVAPGFDDFEVDFRWTETMAEELDKALPEHLRTTASHPDDPEPETGFTPGPLDQPLPGLEP